MTRVVGREEELAAVGETVDAVRHGPAALLIEGEAGIGKTTVLNAGIEAAIRKHLRVLMYRGRGAEVTLRHAALTDLLAEIGDEVLADYADRSSERRKDHRTMSSTSSTGSAGPTTRSATCCCRSTQRSQAPSPGSHQSRRS